MPHMTALMSCGQCSHVGIHVGSVLQCVAVCCSVSQCVAVQSCGECSHMSHVGSHVGSAVTPSDCMTALQSCGAR